LPEAQLSWEQKLYKVVSDCAGAARTVVVQKTKMMPIKRKTPPFSTLPKFWLRFHTKLSLKIPNLANNNIERRVENFVEQRVRRDVCIAFPKRSTHRFGLGFYALIPSRSSIKSTKWAADRGKVALPQSVVLAPPIEGPYWAQLNE
jgi:hypothetical protein